MSASPNSKPIRTAVILSASTNGLGAVRSLYQVGVPTIVVADKPEEPALLSRLPKQKLVAHAESSEQRESRLLEALDSIQDERPVLIPTSDYFVTFMIRNREALRKRFDFCLPDTELTSVLIDKSRETRLIESLGIPLPKTVQALPPQAGALMEQLRLPLIIKPYSFEQTRILGRKNVLIASREELDAFYAKHGSAPAGVLAQEVIPGGDDTLWVCNCAYGNAHELVEAFTFRRLRLSPPHYGVTSYAVSQRNEEVIGLVRKLGTALRYTGPAMVEFKFDSRDGQYKYIELNPRIGLCNFFDTTCGVNNVLHTYRLALGADPDPGGNPQRENVMYLCLFEDLYSRLEDGESIWSALGDYLRHMGRLHVGAHLVWFDPWPALVVGVRDMRRVSRSILRKISRKVGLSK